MWVKNISNSIKTRLLLIFIVVLVLFSIILAAVLDRIQVQEKQQYAQQYLLSQSFFFEHCVHQKTNQTSLLYESCYHSTNDSVGNHFYYYNTNEALIWSSRTDRKVNREARRILALHKDQNVSQYNVVISQFSISGDLRTLIIVMPLNRFNESIANFRWKLLIFFALLIALTSAGLYWLIGVGFGPVTRMAQDLETIASGKGHQLEGQYETEFSVMQVSLNNLLNAEKLQRERYRNTLADLAHSLKTPLAVLQGAANENLTYAGYLTITKEQLRRMDQIIQYQLNRAVKSIGDGTKTSAVAVAPIVERILSALAKVYREKDVKPIINLDRSIELIADERDLMEVLGNMLENAYKYCRSEVAVSMHEDEENVYIACEDDGPGISEHMRVTILERGERADTSAAPGQGIGLSVAVDILSSYNCRLEVEDSLALGGAKFCITFPKY